MNWKKRYTELKVGDKVRFLKTNEACDILGGCCRSNGFKIGVIGKINTLQDKNYDGYGISLIEKSNGTGNCVFPRECFERL